jgi:hypothetical protein
MSLAAKIMLALLSATTLFFLFTFGIRELGTDFISTLCGKELSLCVNITRDVVVPINCGL